MNLAPTTAHELDDVALHEAGHVVASLVVGGPLPRLVTLDRVGENLGRVEWDRPELLDPVAGDVDAIRSEALRAATIDLAGLAAVAIGSCRPHAFDEALAAGRLDLAHAVEVLALAFPGEADARLAHVLADTLALFRQPSVLLTARALAAVLDELRTLEGEALDEVLRLARRQLAGGST